MFRDDLTMGVLEGQVALVTGGASGIGGAIATLFGSAGASVSVVDVDEVGGFRVAQAIVERGGHAIFVSADVSQASDVQRAVEQTVQQLGGLTILVNNAGLIRRTSVVESTEEEWDRVMAVNVKSVFLFSKLAVPLMAIAGGGTIINMASGWGLVGGRRAASYCASKGAVVLLTKAMAIDHGHDNIRVNCICPGDIDTPLLHDEAQQLGEAPARFLAEAARRPLGRIGQPRDVARAALYLASGASSFVTGATMVVDGGGLAGSA